MRIQRMVGRLASATALGLAGVAACGASATPPAPPPASAATQPLPEPLLPEADAGSVEAARRAEPIKDTPSGDASAPRCPYGELSDPHRGFVRCLTPDERDAGFLPPPSQEPSNPPRVEAPDVTKDTNKDKTSALSGAVPQVEIGAPKFENGEVTKVEKVLGSISGDIARCIADHGGLSGASGSVKIQFLVRARGRAEGVEVLSAKGIGGEASACIRLLLKNKPIGAPTADPVGVTITLSLKPSNKP